MNQVRANYGDTNVTQRFQSKTIIGFSFRVRLDQNGGIAPLKSDFLGQNIPIRAQLLKDGKNYTIVDGVLGHISKDMAIGNNEDRWVNYNSSLIAVASGVFEIRFTLKFPCPIELKGNDAIDLSIGFPTSGYYQTNIANLDTANSYIIAEEIEGVGRMPFIPFVRSYPIAVGKTSDTIAIGSNVLRASYSTADDLLLNDAHIMNTLTIQSDKINTALTKSALDNLSNSLFMCNLQTGAKMLFQSPAPLNNLTVLYDGSAASADNYHAIVVQGFIPNTKVFQNSLNQMNRHKAQDFNALIA